MFQERLLAFQKRHIALLEKMLEVQEQQAAMVAQAVKATEEDCQVLDTILALVVTFILPTVHPWPHLIPGNCPQPSPKWAWTRLQHHLQWLGPPAAAPGPPADGPFAWAAPHCLPISMWPLTRSCLQWGQQCMWALLSLAP